MCWESFVPTGSGVVVVGRVVSCSGVVLVSVGGLWQRPGAAHGHCAGLSVPLAFSMPVAMGVLHYTKPSCGVSPACRTPVSCNSPDWWRRGRDLRGCGRQSAAPLGENSQMTMVLVEWVCVLAGSVSVVVRCSYVNPLLRAVTRSIAREPAT